MSGSRRIANRGGSSNSGNRRSRSSRRDSRDSRDRDVPYSRPSRSSRRNNNQTPSTDSYNSSTRREIPRSNSRYIITSPESSPTYSPSSPSYSPSSTNMQSDTNIQPLIAPEDLSHFMDIFSFPSTPSSPSYTQTPPFPSSPSYTPSSPSYTPSSPSYSPSSPSYSPSSPSYSPTSPAYPRALPPSSFQDNSRSIRGAVFSGGPEVQNSLYNNVIRPYSITGDFSQIYNSVEQFNSNFSPRTYFGFLRDPTPRRNISGYRDPTPKNSKDCCVNCSSTDNLVINIPCGESYLCETCANEFRKEHGEICNSCREPSTIQTIKRKRECEICYEVTPITEVIQIGECGHLLCSNCAIRLIRSSFQDISTFPINCPRVQCSSKLSSVFALQVQEKMQKIGLPTLSDAEVNKFVKCCDLGLIPVEHRMSCLRCDNSLSTDGKDRGYCIFCDEDLCFSCKSFWHEGLTCKQFKTTQLVKLNDPYTKPCPSCGVGIIHYHGEGCHHISCKACSCEFCYLCLDIYVQGRHPMNGKNCSVNCTRFCGCPPVPKRKPRVISLV